MAVNVEIKPKGLFKKELTIEKIAKLKKLNYGVADSNYRLERDKIGKYTVLYDMNCIGRGIEVSKENKDICLRLSLPTTISEIKLFYELIESICKKLKVKEFLRDEEIVSIENIHNCIEPDKDTSNQAIIDFQNRINSDENEHFVIFGALNPISLGKREISEINGSLENFEVLLNRLQQMDVFYANPILYRKKDNSIFGVYFVGENIPTVVTEKPHLLFESNEKVDEWYVMIPENNIIRFSDFVDNIEKIAYYDSGHFIVSLKNDVIKELSLKYSVDMTTN